MRRPRDPLELACSGSHEIFGSWRASPRSVHRRAPDRKRDNHPDMAGAELGTVFCFRWPRFRQKSYGLLPQRPTVYCIPSFRSNRRAGSPAHGRSSSGIAGSDIRSLARSATSLPATPAISNRSQHSGLRLTFVQNLVDLQIFTCQTTQRE